MCSCNGMWMTECICIMDMYGLCVVLWSSVPIPPLKSLVHNISHHALCWVLTASVSTQTLEYALIPANVICQTSKLRADKNQLLLDFQIISVAVKLIMFVRLSHWWMWSGGIWLVCAIMATRWQHKAAVMEETMCSDETLFWKLSWNFCLTWTDLNHLGRLWAPPHGVCFDDLQYVFSHSL